MGKVFLAIGALAGAALLAQYALSEATHRVMEPGVERATANAEAFAQVGRIAEDRPTRAAEDPALAAFYGETADNEVPEPDYVSTVD